MQVGVIGLPVSGKTSLFETLTGQNVSEIYGTGKLEVHRAMVKLPDYRLDQLTNIFNPKKKVPATIEYIEIGGIEKEKAKKVGFDSQFLQVLKTTDILCLVIRSFENEFHPHPDETIDPFRDLKIVEAEFLLSDLSIVENRIERLEKQVMKAKDEDGLRELEQLNQFKLWLEQEKPLRELEISEEDKFRIKGFQFLSAKPMIVVLNINERDIRKEEKILSPFINSFHQKNLTFISMCIKIEQEISQLDTEDARMFLEDLGINEPALPKFIRASYDLLGLISFFTVGDEECHAWTIKKETNAQKAAGTVHSDFEKGFIRAEIVNFNEFIQYKSLSLCREKGILRLEGKNYIVKDGDLMTIRFNI
jgi:GTP-binding protein YchF